MKPTGCMPYIDKDKTKGVHLVVSLVEFSGKDWKTVEIPEETGEPEWAGNTMEATGRVAPQFVNNARMLAVLGFTPI